MRRKMLYIIIGIIFILILIIRIYIDSEMIEVTKLNIVSSKIPIEFEEYKIIQLSDLHNKSFGKNNERLIEAIDKETPDIVVMTGDMVSVNDKDFTAFYNLVSELSKKYKLYYIYGNHEGELSSKNRNKIDTFLRENNVTILNNDCVKLTSGDDEINMYGLCYTQKYYSHKNGEKHEITKDYIENKLGSLDKEKFNILLSHNPMFFDAYEKHGADLILTGHIHGGLIRLPMIGGLFSPDRTFFPKYSAGMYESGESKLVVNRGLSRGVRGFRLFNRPEIISITLKIENDADNKYVD